VLEKPVLEPENFALNPPKSMLTERLCIDLENNLKTQLQILHIVRLTLEEKQWT
jgi:hypothetical protein